MAPKTGYDVQPPRRSRRGFLQSSLLAGGAGLALDDVLRLRSQAVAETQGKSDTAVIQIWLGGGPSQFETFDPKPQAPSEIRGPYSPIATKIPGISFCEMIPKMAQIVDRASIIRSVTHTTNGHFTGAHWCSTGYPGTAERATHPSAGAVTSRFRGSNRPGLPGYVLLADEQTKNLQIGEVMGPGHLGGQYSPFTVLQDPFFDEFNPQKIRQATASLQLADDMTVGRAEDRRSLLAGVDRLARSADIGGSFEGVDQFTRAALEMVATGEARQAFDLNRESPETRDMYGRHRWGQMALLARRLVEAGVTFVTLNTAPDSLSWDWHRNIVNDHRPSDGSQGPNRGMEVTGPPMDQMVSALVTDLYERGLDRRVLLVVWGEFGRTPRVNKTGGRDHWGSLMSILLAGGGLKTGQVLGASNDKGEVPVERPVSPGDVLATIYRHLGINPTQETITPAGRPVPVLPEGSPIYELI
ncbi:MAG: DUF1501 domain-containing protein [Fuerstiella sp.]|nr:DUF1501 domain-containing protein [Fuerstiella sp.]